MHLLLISQFFPAIETRDFPPHTSDQRLTKAGLFSFNQQIDVIITVTVGVSIQLMHKYIDIRGSTDFCHASSHIHLNINEASDIHCCTF